MRTLHELYCILWEEIKDSQYIYSLCWRIVDLYTCNEITFDEMQLLKNHFNRQKPSETQHTDFIKHPNWVGVVWWWNEQGTDERKRFIQKMIEITKDVSNNKTKPFLITREQQQALIDNYSKRAANNSELIGFIDGIEAVMGLISKLSK